MSISDDLNKLSELHQRGVLTDEEFSRAKARVLNGTGAAGANPALAAVNALQRSRSDRWLGGVCGGLATVSGLASWMWRLIFVLAVCFAGTGALVYLLMWILLPQEPATVYAHPGPSA